MAYRALPLDAATFRHVFQKLHLPMQYFHLRSLGGAHCGALTSRMYKDQDDTLRISISCYSYFPLSNKLIFILDWVMRMGLGPSMRRSSAWVFALTWDSHTKRSIGFLEGFSDEDLSDLRDLLKSCTRLLSHPLMLPELFLHMITAQLNDRIRILCEETFYNEERRTGVSSLFYPISASHAAIRKWGAKEFQEAMEKANKSFTTTIYLKSRIRLALKITQRLLSFIDELEDAGVYYKCKAEKRQQRERLMNRTGMLETYEHQAECVLKRIENLNTVVRMLALWA